MSQKEFYPPPGQQEPTNQNSPAPAEQKPVPQIPQQQQQNVPLGQQTMPQQYIPTSQQPMPQQQYMPPGQQPMPQQQYMPAGPQPMPQQQYMPAGQQPMPQQQYMPPGPQPMPQQQYMPPGLQPMPQQQYGQQMPRQYYQQPGQAMLQHYHQGFAPQPMLSPGVGQSPTPFLGALQPWSTELFDCAQDMENSLITAFFPCFTFGRIAEITDRGMSSCTGAGLIYGLLMYFTGLHWIYSWMYRTRLRATYSLAEYPCHDCLVHAFCDPCALCQEYRELKNRGFMMELGWAGNIQMQQNAGVPPPVQSMTK